jgi:hypothetical protein
MTTSLQEARTASPGTSDESLIAGLAEGLISEWMLTPPIPLEVVAASRGIARVELADLDVAGCLITRDGESTIKLRKADPVQRRVFSGFHEVGHTFMEGYQLQIQFRCSPFRAAKDPTEVLCDRMASELLLPRSFFARDIEDSAFSIDSVAELSDKYAASFEATAIRFTGLGPAGWFLLRLERMNKPKDVFGAPPMLRAASIVPPLGHRPYIPRFKSLDEHDPLQAVLADRRFDGTTHLDGLTDGSTKYRVSAKFAPWLDVGTGQYRERVLAIARPIQTRRN